ncbi:MAG: hypothetical protein AB7H80_04365 [Candidatus Kapaibacterium sp.]
MQELIPSTLVALFKRKGREGNFTKTISGNDFLKKALPVHLESDEVGVIVYYKSEEEWFLLSNKRIYAHCDFGDVDMGVDELENVAFALEEERRVGVRKDKFSLLKIRGREDNETLLRLEGGLPFFGVYNVLDFLAGRNRSADS